MIYAFSALYVIGAAYMWSILAHEADKPKQFGKKPISFWERFMISFLWPFFEGVFTLTMNFRMDKKKG